MPKPYPREFKDDVVRVALGLEDGVTLAQVAKDSGIHGMTLSSWMRQAEDAQGPAEGPGARESEAMRGGEQSAAGGGWGGGGDPLDRYGVRAPAGAVGGADVCAVGANLPIRFDFLDTMGGGNLLLQVHPQTDYIAERFGMTFTQDESYYLLDAGDDAVVYLGTKTGTDPEAMLTALEEAQSGEAPFPAEEYVNTFPARKHDHFLIPAGTVHCSGANSMVLEISATPFIFTFKMWDWGRVGLDGVPRPIHLEHAAANIRWERDTEWVTANLVDQVTPLREGDGWRVERTGLHELEFIETERAWFTGTVPFDTGGTLNVLNLVQGEEAVVESPTGVFEPFVVHYAETFIVPAGAGRYTIKPAGAEECGVVRTLVRGT